LQGNRIDRFVHFRAACWTKCRTSCGISPREFAAKRWEWKRMGTRKEGEGKKRSGRLVTVAAGKNCFSTIIPFQVRWVAGNHTNVDFWSACCPHRSGNFPLLQKAQEFGYWRSKDIPIRSREQRTSVCLANSFSAGRPILWRNFAAP